MQTRGGSAQQTVHHFSWSSSSSSSSAAIPINPASMNRLVCEFCASSFVRRRMIIVCAPSNRRRKLPFCSHSSSGDKYPKSRILLPHDLRAFTTQPLTVEINWLFNRYFGSSLNYLRPSERVGRRVKEKKLNSASNQSFSPSLIIQITDPTEWRHLARFLFSDSTTN